MTTDIYWNSHRKLFSVRVDGAVVDHVRWFGMKDAEFVVSPAGQQRARDSQTKNVHAFVRGCLSPDVRLGKTLPVQYHFTSPGFTMVGRGCVAQARAVYGTVRDGHPHIYASVE